MLAILIFLLFPEEGVSCSMGEKPVDQLLMTLAYDCVQPEWQAIGFSGSKQDLNSLIFLYQHWAFVHMGCARRLILCFKDLVDLPYVYHEKSAGPEFCRRLSFGLRILKLVRNLMKDIPNVGYDASLLQEVALCADLLPRLFKIGCEFANNQAVVEGSSDCLVLLLLEEFLLLVQVVFCNSCAFQNIQVCIVASLLDNLDSSIWRYNKSAANPKPPLVYFPRSVLHILKLIKDLRRQTYQALDLKGFDTVLIGSSTDMKNNYPLCHAHSEKVPLLKKFNIEDLWKIIFAPSTQWMDNLMHLIFFLYCEGVKLRPKVERSHSSSLRTNCPSEVENVVCHDDEALFGNLFSEGGRSLGSTDGYDQPPVTVNSCSGNGNMPMQAASELLSFLKECVFSHDWSPFLFEDGHKRLRENHIDILLSILISQGRCSEDKSADRCAVSLEEKKIGHIYEICFELLQNLLTCHALSGTLEEYLVEKILNVENGAFVYNDQTLTLLSHTLCSRKGLAGSQLRTRLYEGFVGFIVDKSKAVCLKCLSIMEFIGTLPSVFHIEILLMAFHLSLEREKATLANLIFSSLQRIDAPSAGFCATQLSCWALIVSRLILLLRHMMFYPHTCPTSLLLDFRSKLREVPGCTPVLPNIINDQASSWASIAVKVVLSEWVEADPSISALANQLIDVSAVPPLLCRDELAIESLCLSWKDISATFSQILGFWKGRRAAAVEDLIVERYMFLLCVDIPIMSSRSNKLLLWSETQSIDISNMMFFFHFSHSLIANCDDIGKSMELPDVVIGVLQHLCALHMSADVKELGWDFLRVGFWSSLVLSLLNVGISQYSIKNGVPGVSPFWIENTARDNLYVTVAEGLTSCLIEAGQVPLLLRMLSSLLNRYLQVYQEAFLTTHDDGECNAIRLSSLLLLKHSGLEKSLQDEFLKKSDINSYHLESYSDLFSKWDAIVDKRAPTVRCKVLWECMMHGFPSHLQTPSAILLSCILSIRGIIFVLDRLFGLENLRESICKERAVLCQILSSVMIIKFDRIFESIRGKCEAIVRNLSSGSELSDYSDLFLMKHMEGFLREINARDEHDSSTLEWVITKIINTADSLWKDPLKSAIFKFYLGVEDASETVEEFYGLQRGDLLVLLDSLDNCASESVNGKVLSFFVDLLLGDFCPNLKQKVEKNFFEMDVRSLSTWLEKRLLGCVLEASDGAGCAKGNSVFLRETTMNFILSLVSSPSELHATELNRHLFEAVLASLDTAFLLFDVHVAKSYFQFVVQLSRGEYLMKLLLTRTVVLMEKLAVDDRLLPGLKFLFGFFGNVLSDSETCKKTLEKKSGKSLSGSNLGTVSVVLKPIGSRKNSDSVVLSASQEGGSAAVECDATSVDEDEDDGTSDGEVASIDKDDEEDTNSERTLASKVCTFTSSGSNFMEQHWYFCYTCDLTVSKGCCSVCAKVCHRGHRVVYSRSSRFFCDCGAGGVRGSNCQCLKPRKFTGSESAPIRSASNFQSFLPFSEDADQLPESDSDLDEDLSSDTDNSLRLSIPRELQDGVTALLQELDVEGRILQLCSSLMPSITSKRGSNLSKDKKIVLGKNKVLSYGADLLHLKKAYKGGSLDLKIKADYPNAKELRSHLASGSLVKSLLSVSSRGRLAVGEGDKVAIFDVGQLIGQATIAPVTADKTNIKPLSRNVVRFEIVHLTFNSVVENYLAVAGYEDCQVLTLNPRGEVTDRLAIELALQGAYIRQISWVPGSQVKLMVVTNRFIKIYDLSQDNISPLHYITMPDDIIVDATLLMASQGRMFLVVLSEQGSLFRLELSVEGNVGATPLKEIINIQDREINAKGSSLYYSSTYKLLFISYQDGTTLMGQLSLDATYLTEMSFVYEDEQDGNMRPAGLHRWRELLMGSGLFVCFSSVKSNAALAVSMGLDELHAQSMRHAVSSTSHLVGLTAYKPLSKDKIHCLVLHDDGSLQIYSHIPSGSDGGASLTAEKVKKLGSGILNNKAYAGVKPEFPLDFFEKTVCITADVKLGGDAIRNSDSEAAKHSLASEDGFLESPSPAGFKVLLLSILLATVMP